MENEVSSSPKPLMRRQISKEALAELDIDLNDTMVYVDLDEPNLDPLQQLVDAQEFNDAMRTQTLSSMYTLLDSYMQRMLDPYLSIDVNSPMSLKDTFTKIRKDMMQLVIEFLDDRLVQDRESFLSMKKVLVKEVHNARETTHLYLNAVELATNQKKFETVKLVRKGYQELMEREKTTISSEVQRLTTQYNSLFSLNEYTKKEVAQLEKTVTSLESKIIHMTESHHTEVTKLQEYFQEQLDITKTEQLFLKRAQDMEAGLLEDEFADKDEPEIPCDNCKEAYDGLSKKIAELQAEIRMADAVYQMKTTPAPKATSHHHPSDSPPKSTTRKRPAKETNEEAIIKQKAAGKKSVTNKVPGSRQSSVSGAGHRPSSSTAHASQSHRKGKGKGGEVSRSSSRQNSARGERGGGGGGGGGGNDYTDDDDADSDTSSINSHSPTQPRMRGNAGRSRKGQRSLRGSRASQASEKSFTRENSYDDLEGIAGDMSDNSEDLDLNSLRRRKERRSSRDNLSTEEAEQADAIAGIVDYCKYRMDPDRMLEFARELKAGRVRCMIPTEDGVTQTSDSVDDLLRTYLEATKEVSAMYLETSESLKVSESKVEYLERAKVHLDKRLAYLETKLKHGEEMHDLQLKERNLLLVELTDQLTVARRKIIKEQKIREHIIRNDAAVHGLDRSPVHRREYTPLPILKLDTSVSPSPLFPPSSSSYDEGRGGGSTGGTFLTGGLNSPSSDYASISTPTTQTPWSSHNNSMKHGVHQSHLQSSPSSAESPDRYSLATGGSRERSVSPENKGQGQGQGRRYSTSGGNSVSFATNVRYELRKGMLNAAGDSIEPNPSFSSPHAIDSHRFAKQTRIKDEAGHRSVMISTDHEQHGIEDMSAIIDTINSDPTGKMSDDRMDELRNVREQILTLLASKVVAKKKPPPTLATAKAKDEHFRGRALNLKALPSLVSAGK